MNWREKGRRFLWPAGLAVLAVLWSFCAERKIFFLEEITQANQVCLYVICKLLLVAVVAGAVSAARAFVLRYREEEMFRREMRFWIGLWVFLVFCYAAVYILTWPGFWDGDSGYVLGHALGYQDELFRQGLFTGLLFILTMMVIPVPQAILFVQFALFAAIVVQIARMACRMLGARWGTLVAAPALLPPILMDVGIPLRAILFSALFCWLMFFLVGNFFGEQTAGKRELIFAGVATAALAVWRFEAIPLLLLVPLGLIVFRGRFAKKQIAALFVAAVCLVLPSKAVESLNTRNGMESSIRALMLNPLSFMLQEELHGPRLEQDLEVLEESFSLEEIRKQPGITWAVPGTMKTETMQSVWKTALAYADLIVQNPGSFLRARWKTFQAADTQGFWYYPEYEYTQEWMQAVTQCTQEQSARLLRFFGISDAESRMQIYIRLYSLKFFWRNTVPLALTALSLAAGILLRKRPYARGLCLASLLQLMYAALVFLTAPNPWNLYWLPTLFMGWTTGVFALLLIARALTGNLPRRTE